MQGLTDVIIWYLVTTALGWLGFSIAYHLLPALKDRGYTAGRALGLLLWGFIFWLLASLGVLHNDEAGLLFAVLVLGLLALWALRSVQPREMFAWLRSQLSMVLVTEALFLLAFFGWAFVRSAHPEAVGTEKPMELAFINAILNSPTFPPHDPWLSGYAISYYYFGYVLTAMLAKVAGTPGSLAFNLGGVLVFALSAIGAYGLLYNLLNLLPRGKGAINSGAPRFIFASLLAPAYALIFSNLEGFLHMLHTRGLFWGTDAAGQPVSAFWRWLDIKDLSAPPAIPYQWTPTRFWWWWRASRVLQDYDMTGSVKEIIDEFPFFSYLLADLHPHVLAMPYAFLAMTLALNLFLGGGAGRQRLLRLRLSNRIVFWMGILAIPAGILSVIAGGLNLSISFLLLGILLLTAGGFVLLHSRPALVEYGLEALWRKDQGSASLEIPFSIQPACFVLMSTVLGGLAFMNTWDFPVYVALCAAAYALGDFARHGQLRIAFLNFIGLGLALGLAGGLLYLPFYLSFSSQAGGIVPNLIYPTRGAHLWVMFGVLLVPILALLVHLARRERRSGVSLRQGFLWALGLILGLWAFSLFLGIAIAVIPGIGDFYMASLGATDDLSVFGASFLRRFQNIGSLLTLFFLLGLSLALLAALEKKSKSEDAKASPIIEKADLFAVLLALFGMLLVLSPEFVYLRDLFGWRMNTIFKFYYQAWLIWSIPAAYGALVLFKRLRGAWGVVFTVGMIVLWCASLVYPVLSLWNKTNGFQARPFTLDSTAYFARQSPDEMAAIQWLQNAPPGVIAEAVPEGGGSYSEYARFATLSGKPAVLGWVGHENQWRGEGRSTMLGPRQGDLMVLYCSRDWEQTRAILDQYHVRYVVVSNLERITYKPDEGICPVGLVEAKFLRNLNPVFRSGQVAIYEYAPAP